MLMNPAKMVSSKSNDIFVSAISRIFHSRPQSSVSFSNCKLIRLRISFRGEVNPVFKQPRQGLKEGLWDNKGKSILLHISIFQCIWCNLGRRECMHNSLSSPNGLGFSFDPFG